MAPAPDTTTLMERIEDSVATLLDGSTADHGTIRNIIKLNASMLPGADRISAENIETIIRRLEVRFDTRMNVGNLLVAEGYTPWLDANRDKFDFYYWNRYKRLLPKKKFNREVINVLDIDTNNILDHLENPLKEGQWTRKGLIVGHVQSGKTANYTGLLCKAADAGYKVIIVMAGLLNGLRNQTQERIDEGFIGLDSSRQLEPGNLTDKLTGVGMFYEQVTWRTPVPLTTRTQDFDRNIATQLRTQIRHFNEPVILVIKKNVTILRNLIDWLRNNNSDLYQFPMLLIDDEADHASVNTSKEDDDPTATNSRIRELLKLFDRCSYLGYTATPFANIFIDPDSNNEMLLDDLFPRDFIINLDAPTNYVGAERIFEEDGDLDIVRVVNDHEDILPLNHKKDDHLESLPGSLRAAIRSFILIKAARNIRGQVDGHNSMLINISRFTAIQNQVKWQVHEYLDELRNAIDIHHALSPTEALSNSSMLNLRETWDHEFSRTEITWSVIQNELRNAVSSVAAIAVNQASKDSLDYNRQDYPAGRNVIVIGGLSLSRGLTLEGLTVSYFLRNSIMYDTLMQMGRWFGYRTDYEDICRIYMTEQATSWYAYISKVTRELREEFRRMELAKMTPQDFGLCVRSHPETLIVTARNKMRTGRTVTREIGLEGRLVETAVLLKTRSIIAHNQRSFRQLIDEITVKPAKEAGQPGYLYRDVPVSSIKRFIGSFSNHPASQLTEPEPLVNYSELLEESGVGLWDIIIISLSQNTASSPEIPYNGLKIIPQLRTVADSPGNGVELNRRRLASRGHEKAGLSRKDIDEAEKEFRTTWPDEKKNFPDSIYRARRTKPLLMLHFLDCRKDNEKEIPLFPEGILAYGISFPGKTGSRRPEKLVQYVVTPTWWKAHYADVLDEEDDINE